MSIDTMNVGDQVFSDLAKHRSHSLAMTREGEMLSVECLTCSTLLIRLTGSETEPEKGVRIPDEAAIIEFVGTMLDDPDNYPGDQVPSSDIKTFHGWTPVSMIAAAKKLSTDVSDQLCVVMVGNMSEGYAVYGPFYDFDAASDWAVQHTSNIDTWVMHICAKNKMPWAMVGRAEPQTNRELMRQMIDLKIRLWKLYNKAESRVGDEKSMDVHIEDICVGVDRVSDLTDKQLDDMWAEIKALEPA